jgi:hypothetical protein
MAQSYILISSIRREQKLPGSNQETIQTLGNCLKAMCPSSSSWPHIGWGETSLLDFLCHSGKPEKSEFVKAAVGLGARD